MGLKEREILYPCKEELSNRAAQKRQGLSFEEKSAQSKLDVWFLHWVGWAEGYL